MSQFRFSSTFIALSVALCSASSYASIVRDDVNYQYFRDFAENKGQFQIGASNIEIINNHGQAIGTMLPNVPMPDLRVAIKGSAVATLLHSQYVNSVKHNGGYGNVEFGNESRNPDEHTYSYLIADRNNHAKYDYHVPRLTKLVTEVAPISLVNVPFNGESPARNVYLDKNRFPYFVRIGSGRQVLQVGSEYKQIAGAYSYVTGGTPLNLRQSQDNWLQTGGQLSDNPLDTYGIPGDSGSPLFAYDAQEKRWVLVGVLTTYTGYENKHNTYIISRPADVQKIIDDDELKLQINDATKTLTWRKDGEKNSKLFGANGSVDLPIRDQSQIAQDQHTARLSFEHGKSLHLTGNGEKTLILAENIDQGAGALYFHNNFTVRGEKADTSWQGAGVVVDENQRVNWALRNPQGDRLSKLGKGTLYVNGKGENLGDISVGEGTVVLAQQAENGKQQAFNQVGITSGRATVVLNDTNQVKPDHIYFGFRGGRLDVNGNDLNFHYIQNADDGAQIVNHNTQKVANLTVTGKTDYTQDQIEMVNWSQRGKNAALTLYEYKNNHRNNRLDYYVLKPGGRPNAYFSWDMESSKDWEFLSNDKQTALNEVLRRANAAQRISTFSGKFGETDANLANGKLNVTFAPDNADNIWLLNGGMQLNGTFAAKGGRVLLSGVPVSHAYDHLAQKDVVNENEWIDRTFQANQFELTGNAQLHSGRNVSKMLGNFAAHQHAKLQLGFIQGRSMQCIRSDYSGETQCTNNAVMQMANLHALPSTQIIGDMQLFDQSELLLGKAHWQGAANAAPTTHIQLSPNAQWTLSKSSQVGNLTLENGASITLNEHYEDPQKASQFNELTVNGRLEGNGTLRFLTDVNQHRGDHLKVNGLASGEFLLAVKNRGSEANAVDGTSLVTLRHPDQKAEKVSFALENGFVDLGAYRYILTNQNNDYRLYNPLRDGELQAQATQTLIDESKKRFDELQLRLQQQQIKLEQLNQRYAEAQRQENYDQARMKDLLAQIHQTNNDIDRVFFEYNRTSRIRFIKRSRLYREFNRLQSKLSSQRQDYVNLKHQIQETKALIATLIKTVADAKVELQTVSGQHDVAHDKWLNQELNSLNAINKAQELCAAQGLSNAVCQKVAKVANESDESAFEADLDAQISAVEAAQAALDFANTQGDQAAIAQAQANLTAQAQQLAEKLQAAQLTFQQIQQLINQYGANAAIPVQNAWLSRYANSAISEFAANVNGALQLTRSLDRQMNNAQSANVWANQEVLRQRYQTDAYRPFKQTLHLTQLGIAQPINDKIELGAIFSHSRASNEFAENVTGKQRLTTFTGYLKARNDWGFAALDGTIGRTQNRLDFDSKTHKFSRNFHAIGANLGVYFNDIAQTGVNLTPSIGVRWAHLGGINYALDGAQIQHNRLNLLTYRAGFSLDKTIDFGSWSITPKFASYYQQANAQKAKTYVNQMAFSQDFGHFFNHEIGALAQFKQWQIGANIGLVKGSEFNTQKYAQLSLGFNW